MGDINPDGLPNLTLEEKEKGRSAGYRMLCVMHGAVFGISFAVGYAVFSLGQKAAYTAKILTVQSGQFPRIGGGVAALREASHLSGPLFLLKLFSSRRPMAARTRGILGASIHTP